ncbi:hypothetical protein LINPERPRIM_LOCUS18646 [Linum perenne]
MAYYGRDEPLVDQTPEGSTPQPRDASLL